MKKGVILVFLLVLSISFVYAAKEVSIPEYYKSGDTVSDDEGVPVAAEGERGDLSGETTYYYAGARLLASDHATSGRKYYYQDRLGSNRIIIDDAGVDEFKSLPFGQVVKDGGERFSFTGKELDDSGLYDFGARQYDADLGKFISSDPAEDSHPYAYVDNNPLDYIDPDGMISIPTLGLMNAIYGANDLWPRSSISVTLGGGGDSSSPNNLPLDHNFGGMGAERKNTQQFVTISGNSGIFSGSVSRLDPTSITQSDINTGSTTDAVTNGGGWAANVGVNLGKGLGAGLSGSEVTGKQTVAGVIEPDTGIQLPSRTSDTWSKGVGASLSYTPLQQPHLAWDTSRSPLESTIVAGINQGSQGGENFPTNSQTSYLAQISVPWRADMGNGWSAGVNGKIGGRFSDQIPLWSSAASFNLRKDFTNINNLDSLSFWERRSIEGGVTYNYGWNSNGGDGSTDFNIGVGWKW